MRLRQIAFRLSGLGLLALILVKLDLKATAAALANVRWSYLLAAVAANLLLFGLKSWRWRELLRMQGSVYPWRDAFLAFVAGLFLGLVTPGRVGEMGKAFYLEQDQGMPLSEGLASVLMDRLFDLYTILVLGAIGLAWFRLIPTWAMVLVAIGTGAALLLPFALLSEQLAAAGLGLVRRLPIVRRYDTRLTEATERFQRALQPLLTPGLIAPLGLTLAAYALFFGQGQLLTLALALPMDIVYLAVCLSVAGVITVLPISISGLGTRDAILIGLFAPLGIRAERAVAFSTLFFLTFYIGGGAIGAVAWLLKPLEKHSARALGNEQ
ncbi:MAG: lysylphosphatidylglycerol synthase transmembrane domain-containing protein [Anaerolineae bacterium]